MTVGLFTILAMLTQTVNQMPNLLMIIIHIHAMHPQTRPAKNPNYRLDLNYNHTEPQNELLSNATVQRVGP